MKNTLETLKTARKILSDEQRWTCHTLVEGVDLKNDPLCNNVKVCALGAVALAAWGPQAVEDMRDDELDEDGIVYADETKEAIIVLDEVSEEYDGAYSIMDLNDNPPVDTLDESAEVQRARGYARLLAVFDEAIERVEAKTS